jgi:adenosylcobinamide-GDP ribazoletransferase
MLARQLQLLLCAVQFLTRLPVPPLTGFEPDWTTRAARYFPLVGLLVGGICAAVFWGASRIWSGPVAAVLALGCGVLLTGGFHEDGLADTADGLGGGTTPARRLEIMKDSRVGTYGVLALVLMLGLKGAALAGMPASLGAWALVAAHAAGRAAAVVVMFLLPYAGDERAAKWKPAAGGPTRAEVLLAVGVGCVPIALSPGMAPFALLLGAAAVLALALLARRLIGGFTGDLLGGVEQVFEAGFLLGAAAAANHGGWWF